MNISRLLNPVPNKRSRFDEDTLVCDKHWLPTELIAYIISFFDFQLRPSYRLVSKKWYTAYEQYHRNKVFNDILHIGNGRVTRRQVMKAFVNYGRRLRWMFIRTSTLREILDIEPNFARLIPHVIWLNVTINDGLSSQRWIRDFVARLCKLRKIIVEEFGSTTDEHLSYELDKAIAVMPRFESVLIYDIYLDMNAFPGPNMKIRANQIRKLVVSIENIEPELVASTFTMFKNVEWLGFREISSVDVLKEVTDMVVEEKNFPAMYALEILSEFDLSYEDPIINEEDGNKVTAMDLYLKICSIRRPQFVLSIGFILGACSTTDSVLIEKEREFIINLGRTSAEILLHIDLTHYTPSGDYDPLTTLFYQSAPRFPKLQFLNIHSSPTAITGPRIIEALKNPFLLPQLVQVSFHVDGTQSPEWNCEYDPINRSRGIIFIINEKRHEDDMRRINENNDGVIPSAFLSDDPDCY
ncbi:hypothetical protein GQ42DRAFT_65930 [Ramicandelaber brevisporus]|nr:hypothetical protein GQ42DRAFT_65930 [Ramicandelaber brevisporus]